MPSAIILLFLDADTFFVDGGLDRLVARWLRERDPGLVFSLLPYHAMSASTNSYRSSSISSWLREPVDSVSSLSRDSLASRSSSPKKPTSLLEVTQLFAASSWKISISPTLSAPQGRASSAWVDAALFICVCFRKVSARCPIAGPKLLSTEPQSRTALFLCQP